MKYNYNNDNDFYKEERMVSDSKSQLRGKYKNKLNLVRRSREETKEEERFFSMQLISQEKDPTVGINGFEGIRPEQLMPQQKKTLFSFLEEGKILKGREGNRLTGACPLYYLSFVFLFSLLSFSFSLLSYFLSILFFLSRSSPVFRPLFWHSGGLLIAPAVTKFYYFAL